MITLAICLAFSVAALSGDGGDERRAARDKVARVPAHRVCGVRQLRFEE